MRSIVALTLVISECSGKLKLRMCYVQTLTQNNVRVALCKIIRILAVLTRLLTVKFGVVGQCSKGCRFQPGIKQQTRFEFRLTDARAVGPVSRRSRNLTGAFQVT